MSGLSISLLGSFEAAIDERPLTHFRTKAVQALLIYLVCQPESHTREALMTLLWPDLPLKSAQANLRHALYHLKQVVPEVNGSAGEAIPFVLADRQTVQVNPDGRFHLDISQFVTLCQSDEREDWESAVSLYRSDFLSDFFMPNSDDFENWAQIRRADFRRRLLDTLVRLTSHHIKNQNYERAEQYTRQQLAIDNLREEAHRQLMEILAKSGRRTDALSHYQTLLKLLEDELGIAPSVETDTLVRAIQSDSLTAGIEIKTRRESRDIPNNLPAQTTPFIGRKAELDALDRLLADAQTRLVTILGAGGMGKTRLSLAAAERQLARKQFLQGVYFVPLAGLGESDRIVTAIGEAMEIRLEQGETQLLNYLRAKEILLVLDNFEHLLDGSSLVVRLLDTAPALQILVTSRERLRLQVEQIYPVQGLGVDQSAITDDARTLFLQAARRLRPDFEITTEIQPTINNLCRMVEGMPLALELAAAWVDLFTLEDITAEIQRNFDFLEIDFRDIPSRHRSMQAVFDTSWQRLSINLQQVLAAIGVFRGGFTREAVAAVAQASLGDLAKLTNKSLISFDAATNRYYIHELLRQYSLAHLTGTVVQDRHCDYYLEWLVQKAPKLTGAEQDAAVILIEKEMDNIRAAINHALRMQKIDDFILVMHTLGLFYENYTRPTEGVTLFDQIRTQLSSASDTPLRILFWATAWQVRAYGGLGHRKIAKQVWALGRTYLDDLTRRESETRAEQAMASYIEGFDLYIQHPDKAFQLLQQSHQLALNLGDLRMAGQTSRVMGLVARNQGDLDKAKAAANKSLSLFQTLNDRRSITGVQILLGELASKDGRYDEAEKQLLEAISISRQYRLPSLEYGLSKLQMVYIFSGQFKKARPTLEENRLAAEEYNFLWGLARNNLCLGLLLLHQGKLHSEVYELGKKTLHLGQKNNVEYFICEALLLISQVDIAVGNLAAARERLQDCDRRCPSRSIGSLYIAGNDLYLGILEVVRGKTAVARQHLHAELETAVQRHDKLNVANALAAFALHFATDHQPVSALETYAVAQQHPFVANSLWFANVVEKRITAASNTLSPVEVTAAQARGKEMDIWETAESLLNSLGA